MPSTEKEVSLWEPRSSAWFHHEQGLSNFGFLPGFPRSNPLHLPQTLVSEEECVARWNRDASGFRYASHGSEESPRMQVRIEDLFLLTHQRCMGRTKAIGLSFARGILAEKKGLPVNWAEFAEKQCRRSRTPDTPLGPKSMRSSGVEQHQKYWLFDEESKTVKFDYPGSDEDWKLNTSNFLPNTVATGGHWDYPSIMLSNFSPQTIARPLYRGTLFWQGISSALAEFHYFVCQ